jgi:hypothetical protein
VTVVGQTGPGDPLGLVPQLVALAGDQAETRGRVDQLTAAVEDVGGQLADLAGNGAVTEAQLSAVRTAVEELTAAVERLSVEPDRPAVWTWVGMDTDTRREALRELARWVDEVLVGRYQLDDRVLPRCWYRHPDAVEELSWLYADWTRVYRGGRGSSTSAAGEWHDRWKPGVLDRITKALAGCAVGDHRPPVRQPLPATDGGFETYLTTLDQPQPAEPSPSGASSLWPGQHVPSGPSVWQDPPPSDQSRVLGSHGGVCFRD